MPNATPRHATPCHAAVSQQTIISNHQQFLSYLYRTCTARQLYRTTLHFTAVHCIGSPPPPPTTAALSSARPAELCPRSAHLMHCRLFSLNNVDLQRVCLLPRAHHIDHHIILACCRYLLNPANSYHAMEVLAGSPALDNLFSFTTRHMSPPLDQHPLCV